MFLNARANVQKDSFASVMMNNPGWPGITISLSRRRHGFIELTPTITLLEYMTHINHVTHKL